MAYRRFSCKTRCNTNQCVCHERFLLKNLKIPVLKTSQIFLNSSREENSFFVFVLMIDVKLAASESLCDNSNSQNYHSLQVSLKYRAAFK